MGYASRIMLLIVIVKHGTSLIFNKTLLENYRLKQTIHIYGFFPTRISKDDMLKELRKYSNTNLDNCYRMNGNGDDISR